MSMSDRHLQDFITISMMERQNQSIIPSVTPQPHTSGGGDWRLKRLRQILRDDPQIAPGFTQRAFVAPNDLVGYRVIRPGVPDINARESWHLTRKRAERAASAWNGVLDAA